MFRLLYAVFVASAIITYTKCANVALKRDEAPKMTEAPKLNDNSKTEAPSKRMDQEMEDDSIEENDFDLKAIMKECNESFIVEMSMVMSLNETGSFPDETDKTPMCYLRCVLQELDILSADGELDAARTAAVYSEEWAGAPQDSIQEIATACASTANQTCKCEKSYKYLKCVFSKKIEMYDKTS